MITSEQNESAARRCVELFNNLTLGYVETCYAPNVDWTELPLPPATPAGQHGDRAALSQAAGRALGAFPDRTMKIINLVAQGDQVVLELDWRGTMAVTAGSIRAGTVVHCRLASFLSYANGLIVKQVDYCVAMPASAS